jgi:hypothetical protein
MAKTDKRKRLKPLHKQGFEALWQNLATNKK